MFKIAFEIVNVDDIVSKIKKQKKIMLKFLNLK